MDYYRMNNIVADTQMRNMIGEAGPEGGKTEPLK